MVCLPPSFEMEQEIIRERVRGSLRNANSDYHDCQRGRRSMISSKEVSSLLLKKKRSDESLLEELRRVAVLYGGPFLSTRTFEQHTDRMSVSSVRRRFGSWQAAITKAGLPYGGPILTEKMKAGRSRRLSSDDVIAEMKRVQALINRDILTTSDFKGLGKVGIRVVRGRFGTWTNALKQAGIAQSELANKRWTNEECLDNIALIWTYYGRQPSFQEMMFPPSAMSGYVYLSRWGTWRNALRAFAAEARARRKDGRAILTSVIPSNIGQIVVRKQKSAPGPDRDKGYLSSRLRFVVFQRDRFRCVVCGRSPATHLSVVLHADHVRPIALGGTTSLENLQTLCYECNMGKGRFPQ
jgi:hypothetical protein